MCTYFWYTRCGVPSSCCKESYRMESGLIKIRCGFELQDKSKFSDSVVKEKVNFQEFNNLISTKIYIMICLVS